MNNLMIEAPQDGSSVHFILPLKDKRSASDNELLKNYRKYYKKGKAAKSKKDYALAYVFFNDALYYARLINWKEALAYVKLEIADIDLATNKYSRAYKHYMACLNFTLIYELDSIISIVYFKLSTYYSIKGNGLLSKEYNDRAIKAIAA